MTDRDEAFEPVPRAPRPWVAIALGASTGLLAAAAGILAWTLWNGRSRHDVPPPHETAQIDLFRLSSGGAREAMLVPAGPDATGEPRLAERLFPGEKPPRELASLVLSNVSPREAWDVDLRAEPIRCRVAGGVWEDVRLLGEMRAGLAPAEDVRLRALGGLESRVRLEPGALRQVLLALPANRRISDLSDVEWGGRPLVRERLGLERLRRFREDPAATVTGR